MVYFYNALHGYIVIFTEYTCLYYASFTHTNDERVQCFPAERNGKLVINCPEGIDIEEWLINICKGDTL